MPGITINLKKLKFYNIQISEQTSNILIKKDVL